MNRFKIFIQKLLSLFSIVSIKNRRAGEAQEVS